MLSIIIFNVDRQSIFAYKKNAFFFFHRIFQIHQVAGKKKRFATLSSGPILYYYTCLVNANHFCSLFHGVLCFIYTIPVENTIQNSTTDAYGCDTQELSLNFRTQSCQCFRIGCFCKKSKFHEIVPYPIFRFKLSIIVYSKRQENILVLQFFFFFQRIK